MSALQYWVWLSMRAVRPEIKNELLSHCDDVRTLYYARRADLTGLDVRLRPAELSSLLDKDLRAADGALELCERRGVSIITLQDAQYPVRLGNLTDAPCVLYVLGRLPRIDDRPAVTVIGTRRASDSGLRTARTFGADIARSGCILVSGMTDGIDGAAAVAAMDAGGTVIGVTGCAIDAGYAGTVAARAAERGAVVSEFAPGDRAFGGFRLRNRITAGLSLATILIEAPEKSGALLFARETAAQGKETFVVPGDVNGKSCAGSNALLTGGAAPALRAWDVLSGFQSAYPVLREPEAQEHPEPEPPAPEQKGIDKENGAAYIDMEMLQKHLTTPELQIVKALAPGALPLDELLDRAGLPQAEAMPAITMLQIMGVVEPLPGKRYRIGTIPDVKD